MVTDGKGSLQVPSSISVSAFKEWGPNASLRQSLPEGADRSCACIAESWLHTLSAPAYNPASTVLNCLGPGLALPLNIKHSRHMNYSVLFPRRSAWPSSCEIFRYLGGTSPVSCCCCSCLFCFNWLWLISHGEQGNFSHFNLKQKCQERKTISCPGL